MNEFWGDLPWIVGLFIAIIYFGIFEVLGFIRPGKYNTLSHAVYTLGAHWSLAIFIMGMFVGSLGTHLFWHYCPAGSINSGALESLLSVASLR
jgi:hypothetical protein